MDEVFLFHGISLDIKEFISVPESVVGDVFILIAAQREMGGGLRVVLFPVIHVEKIVAPGNLPASSQGKKTFSIHVGGFIQPHCLHDGGGNINIGNNLLDHRVALNQVRALHEHGHPAGCLVGHALIDQSMFAEHIAVVAHVDDQGLVVDAHLL